MTKGLLSFISSKSDEMVHGYSDNIALNLIRVRRIENSSFHTFRTEFMNLEIVGVIGHFKERLAGRILDKHQEIPILLPLKQFFWFSKIDYLGADSLNKGTDSLI